MILVKQTYIGQYRRYDGRMADVYQNVWDTAPINYSISWQDDTLFYHYQYVAVCPPIDVWATSKKEAHHGTIKNPAHPHPGR